MTMVIDYYLAPQSPWAYLGHERFGRIARAAGATVRVRPVDLGGRVFPVSGGLPLPTHSRPSLSSMQPSSDLRAIQAA